MEFEVVGACLELFGARGIWFRHTYMNSTVPFLFSIAILNFCCVLKLFEESTCACSAEGSSSASSATPNQKYLLSSCALKESSASSPFWRLRKSFNRTAYRHGNKYVRHFFENSSLYDIIQLIVILEPFNEWGV